MPSATITVDVFNQENKKVGEVNLPGEIFARAWNADLVHQALVAQTASERKTIAHAKGRGEVRGGGRKPWKQKGTGRARHGSIRSPIWAGGGVTHGPTKEKIFAKKINKKMKRAAIFSVLSKKTKGNDLRVFESLDVSAPKTNMLAKMLKNIVSGKRSALIIPTVNEKNIHRAAANIQGIKAIDPRSLNVYDLMKYKNILLDKRAVETITSHYTMR